MAAKLSPHPAVRVLNKEGLREALSRVDPESNVVPDVPLTIERLHAMMLADGIRPEENAFSREILRMRDEMPG